MDNITQLGKVTVTPKRLESGIHQSELQEDIEGPMENAVGFLIIPAPRWGGVRPRGERPFLLSPPPFLQSPVPELTQGVRAGEGEVPVDPGVGELERYLVEQRGQS